MPRSRNGGRHELGQNFLHHSPTIERIASLVADTTGSVLEIGAGDGALTRALAALDRPLTAIEIDEHRVRRLRRSIGGARVVHADALSHPLASDVIVGNLPYHLTTPILRRVLTRGTWSHAVLLTQWEVARKRAGVGGSTMMTAQTAPWFAFSLHGRVPSWCFRPRPSVDGGILRIERRADPLLPTADRRGYEAFVRRVFTGRGGSLVRVVAGAAGASETRVRAAASDAGIPSRALPRDLEPAQWAALRRVLR
ncbi:MAG: 23S ribosomal RNA methyltransferase Erm [Microbacterium sp.]